MSEVDDAIARAEDIERLGLNGDPAQARADRILLAKELRKLREGTALLVKEHNREMQELREALDRSQEDRTELRTEVRRLRTGIARVATRLLSGLLDQTLEDGTPVLAVVLEQDPELKRNLREALEKDVERELLARYGRSGAETGHLRLNPDPRSVE